MKILKAIGNFVLKHTTVISLICFTIIFFFAAWTFGQEPTIKNGVFMMLWGVVFVSEVILLRIKQVKEEQQDILRELTKLRHPSQQKQTVFVIRKDKIDEAFEKSMSKGYKFPETKNRDDINESLRYAYGLPFPQGGIIPQPFFEPISTDPRMSAKVTGEFPLTDDEWRNKIENTKAGEPDWTKISNSERKWLEENEPAFKETRDGEVEQDRTIADPPADEVREPFAWGPADMGKFEPATGYDK